jgi:hypothetical protein
VGGISVSVKSEVVSFDVLGEEIKEVNVQIYSLLGKRIHASGWVANGYIWKLQNGGERAVARGIYLYLISARSDDGEVVRTRVKKIAIDR